MGRSDLPPLRSLPRVFVEGADPEAGPIDLPREEVEKLRKVLRLAEGDSIAVLPNDGTLIVCEFRARQGHPVSVERPDTEPALKLTVAQALPKADKLDTIVRQGTEIGVTRFVLFTAERSVVKWDAAKTADRVRRLTAIARESAEQCFRCRLPEIEVLANLSAVLQAHADAAVLSEVEGLPRPLRKTGDKMTIVIGPEGGWAPRELTLIGDRGVTLGQRVLRVDTATAAAAALLLLPE
jgi:16S rRNA (uracil1498-N3)-methyltransferase